MHTREYWINVITKLKLLIMCACELITFQAQLHRPCVTLVGCQVYSNYKSLVYFSYLSVQLHQ